MWWWYINREGRREGGGLGLVGLWDGKELFREKKLGNYGRRSAQDINTLRPNFRPSASQSRLVRVWEKPYSVRTPEYFTRKSPVVSWGVVSLGFFISYRVSLACWSGWFGFWFDTGSTFYEIELGFDRTGGNNIEMALDTPA